MIYFLIWTLLNSALILAFVWIGGVPIFWALAMFILAQVSRDVQVYSKRRNSSKEGGS